MCFWNPKIISSSTRTWSKKVSQIRTHPGFGSFTLLPLKGHCRLVYTTFQTSTNAVPFLVSMGRHAMIKWTCTHAAAHLDTLGNTAKQVKGHIGVLKPQILSFLDVNECSSGPCKNGGTCNNLVNKYTCSCAPGFTGIRCQTGKRERQFHESFCVHSPRGLNVSWQETECKCPI